MRRYFKYSLSVEAEIEKDGDGWHGYVPYLRGVHVYGKDEYEVRELLNQAIAAYLESVLKGNRNSEDVT